MRKQLTPEEVSAVDLVTRGERFSHRRWPPEVVAAFAAADANHAGEEARRGVIFRPGGLKSILRLALLQAPQFGPVADALAGEGESE